MSVADIIQIVIGALSLIATVAVSFVIYWLQSRHEKELERMSEAIVKRIDEICKEKGKNVCNACLGGGKSPSAVYDLMKGRTKCPKVTSVKSFCEGAGITLSEFFDRDYFNDVEDD